METKQTAIEWLIDKVEDHFCLLPVDLIAQAKQMEKEQSIKLIEIACMFQSASSFDEEIGKMTHEDIYDLYYKKN